jgi:hypothetical protein
MAQCRFIIALSLLAVWLAIPALACLPTSQMTQEEMACCKKMAGDCSMGTSQHPCCKTVSTVNPSVATIQPVSQIHPVFATVDLIVDYEANPVSRAASTQAYIGLPSPAPPGTDSILRI